MAYAAVISLKHNIVTLINPTLNPQIRNSAYSELEVLEDILIRFYRSIDSSIDPSVINALDAETREAVWKLEDVLKSYVLYHSLPPSDGVSDESCPPAPAPVRPPDEDNVKQELYLFVVTLKMLEDEYIRELDNTMSGGVDDAVVGLSDQLTKISNELLDDESRCKIVSLVGMAGIGKTTLARKIYERLVNVRHVNVPYFSSTAWVSLGPNCQTENVLVDILAQIEHQPTASYRERDKHKLAELLYKSLYRRRYLIVLDDIGNTKDWGYLMNFLPENKNQSRLLLTSRQDKVPYPTSATHRLHEMIFLTTEESWDLLCRNVFGEEYSPLGLEKAGRKIAAKCEGLPLLILAVAHLLRDHKLTEEYWKEVADKRTNIFPYAYEKISKVLSSSYEPLTQYLKACFLYMGVFPQDSEIPFTKLINLWTVEDFLEPSQSQTLEDFAVKCLEELVSKSLVIVCKHGSNDRIKSCKLHSAYWHLCVIKARKIQFLHVLNKLSDGFQEYIQSHSRFAVQNNILLGMKEVYDSIAAAASTTRSLLCTGEDHQYPVPVCFDLMFLKVLDALAIRFYEFPREVVKLLHLKYLALTHDGDLPSLISKLQNLQSLIIHQYHNVKLVTESTCLPRDIWDMQELRHLRIMGRNLPDPSNGEELPKLLTLHVKGHSCTEDVFRSIPKLKKLGIKIELQPRSTETLSCFDHISILHELESLKCVVVNPRPGFQVVAPPNPSSSFPKGLKKLSLNGLGYSWEYISTIGSLPHLQVLKLRCFAFRGPEWKTEVKQFQSLKFLLLEDIDLVNWTTDDEKCFPRLQRLIIRHCYKIEEIPFQIEDIPTLKIIEIVDCNPLVMDLAQEILEGKKNFGNDSFEVPMTSSLNLPRKVEGFGDGVEAKDD